MNDVENNGININHIGIFIDVITKLINEGYSTKSIAQVLGVEEATLQQEIQRKNQSLEEISFLKHYRDSKTEMDKIRFKYYKAYYKNVSAPSSNNVSRNNREISPQMHKAICGVLEGSMTVEEIRAIICPTPQNDKTKKMLSTLSRRSDIYPINPNLYTQLLKRFVEIVDGETEKVSSFREAILYNLCQREYYREARTLINTQIANEKDTLDISLKSGIISKLNAIVTRKEIENKVLAKIINKISDKDDEEFLIWLRKELLKSQDAKELIQTISLGRDYYGANSIFLSDVFKLERRMARVQKVNLTPIGEKSSIGKGDAQAKSSVVTPKKQSSQRSSRAATTKAKTEDNARSSVRNTSSGALKENIFRKSTTEMDKIREGYYELFDSIGVPYVKYSQMELSDNQAEVNEAIEAIQTMGKTIDDVPTICNRLESIGMYRIDAESCITIIKVLSKLPVEPKTPNAKMVNHIKENIANHFMYEVVQMVKDTSSLEELKELYVKLKALKVESVEFEGLKSSIYSTLKASEKSVNVTTRSNLIDADMEKAIRGFLDFSRDVNEIKPLIFVDGIGRVTRDRSRNMARVIGERADLYPLNPNDYEQLLNRYLTLVNGRTDNNRKNQVINMICDNLCCQKKYDEASYIASLYLVHGRELTPEQKSINKSVNETLAKIVAKKRAKEFLSKILNKVSDEDDRLFLQEIRKEIPRGVKEDAVWNLIDLGKDRFGSNTITLGKIYESQKIRE